MHVHLVPATSDDRTWLDQLRRDVYQDLFVATWGGWDEERHLRHFASTWDRGSIHVVEVDGERVGMIQVFDEDDALHIGEIQVQCEHQGRGIGTRLLVDVMARGRAEGRSVTLSTGLQNHRAVRLYERLGFGHVGRSETHVHMTWEPSEA